MPEISPPLVFPALASLYAALAPLAATLLRLVVAVSLIAHGLRMTFGFFPDSGIPFRSVAMLGAHFDREGIRPGLFWARAISLTQLVAGPLLGLGLLTRLAAVPIVIFLAVAIVHRWRVGGYFWNKMGVEYALLWGAAALYFLLAGGGPYSLDHLLIGREF